MLPKHVVAIREALRLTQQELADLIGCQQHAVARWETGVSEPRGANLKAMRELAEKTRNKTQQQFNCRC